MYSDSITPEKLTEWFNAGKENFRRMIVSYDETMETYWVRFVDDGQQHIERGLKNTILAGERPLEVYDLRMNLETQLNERRAWHV